MVIIVVAAILELFFFCVKRNKSTNTDREFENLEIGKFLFWCEKFSFFWEKNTWLFLACSWEEVFGSSCEKRMMVCTCNPDAYIDAATMTGCESGEGRCTLAVGTWRIRSFPRRGPRRPSAVLFLDANPFTPRPPSNTPIHPHSKKSHF